MLAEKLGHFFDKPLARVASRIPFSPNVISLFGFCVTVLAACVLTFDLLKGGILVLIGGFFDVLDGVVARVNGRASRFGAFLDSVLDRYSDAAILLAIAWNLHHKGDSTAVILCFSTLIGSFLISYARARAEGIGEQCRHGLLERPERIILISLGAITGSMMWILWPLAILTHVTVLQRIRHVWRTTGGS